MYFESHRGSDEGMLAVGTVVANRVASGRYGSSYCEVVGQKRQFAAGVLTRPMDDAGAERAHRTADAIIAGKRHPGVHGAMFFHTAGLRFPYPNMRYVLVAGGNAFYEKRSVASAADVRENARSRAMALAYAKADPTAPAKPIMVASLEPSLAQPSATVAVASSVAPQTAAAVQPVRITTTASFASVSKPAASVTPPSTPAPVVTARAVAPVAPPVPKPAPAEPVLAAVAPAPAAPARKGSSGPVRTISASAEPVLASSAPTLARRPAAKPKPDTSAPVVAFAPSPAVASFPSSGGSRVAADNGSPVAQAWASFQ